MMYLNNACSLPRSIKIMVWLIQIKLGSLLYSNLFQKMFILSKSNLYKTQWVIFASERIVVMLLIGGYS